jgi:hypothetical protein
MAGVTIILEMIETNIVILSPPAGVRRRRLEASRIFKNDLDRPPNMDAGRQDEADRQLRFRLGAFGRLDDGG